MFFDDTISIHKMKALFTLKINIMTINNYVVENYVPISKSITTVDIRYHKIQDHRLQKSK